MITLKTGVPGSGKTLTAVDELRAEFEREDPRPVFVHGIPDLAFACLPLPVYSLVEADKGGKATRNRVEVDWAAVPDGALVVVDEAQTVFPVRGAGSPVPAYVSFLNVHRHRGIDLVLITQHPRLVDVAVRKLVGRHQHYRRLWGGSRHVRYEWDYCSEALQGMDLATKRVAGFPRRAFQSYKSAELHTKPAATKPLWLAVPVVAVLGLVWLAPDAYRVMSGAMSGKGVAAASAPSASGGGGGAVPAGTVATAVPAAASASASWPVDVAGCWITDVACVCMTQGPAPRLSTGLGRLCVDIAAGRLQVSALRPAPRRLEVEGSSPAVAVRPAAGASAPPLPPVLGLGV